ncbi:hypothetical protein BDC45DRAFT_564769 [Circinella umbellata]|nr:hypothetical protein BDC45DRAFT_564769 [Circinella umbellata]
MSEAGIKQSTFVVLVIPAVKQHGIRVAEIRYCKKCKDQHLPIILIRGHLFSLTPEDSNVLIHVAQMRSMYLMHHICNTSIHAISE